MPVSEGSRNYYELLGVGSSATAAEIKQAYRRSVLATHPDLNPGLLAADRLQRVRRAYEVLDNPIERMRYDMLNGLGHHGGRSRFYRRSFDRLIEGLFSNLRTALNNTAMLSDAVDMSGHRPGRPAVNLGSNAERRAG